MLILESSANHLYVELEGRELLAVIRYLDLNPSHVCKVFVTLIRKDLTDESCIENFDSTREHERKQAGLQGTLFPLES